MSAEKDIADVIASPTSSVWLRQSLELALSRDCVDAANEAEYLSMLLNRRCSELLNENHKTYPLLGLTLNQLNLLKNALESVSAREVDPDADVFEVLDIIREARTNALKSEFERS